MGISYIFTKAEAPADALSLEMIIQSHLGDALFEMGFNQALAVSRIKFAKGLIHTFEGDCSKYIAHDAVEILWEELTK